MILNKRARFAACSSRMRNTTLLASGLAIVLIGGQVQAAGDSARFSSWQALNSSGTASLRQLVRTEGAAKPKIDEARASEIALKKIPGEVTGVTIEKKRGKEVFVVEIMAKTGKEIDVFVDMNNGKILGTD